MICLLRFIIFDYTNLHIPMKVFKKILFIYFWRERMGGRKRGRETSGLGSQPRHMPWLGNELLIFSFAVNTQPTEPYWSRPNENFKTHFTVSYWLCLVLPSLLCPLCAPTTWNLFCRFWYKFGLFFSQLVWNRVELWKYLWRFELQEVRCCRSQRSIFGFQLLF